MIYITKEVEIWLDPSDFDDELVPIEELHGLFGFAEALEALHNEYHEGSLWMCAHPVCYSVHESLEGLRSSRNRYEHPSLIALHAHGDRIRRQAEKDRRVLRISEWKRS